MLSKIESLVNPAHIDYLVVNHLEMDHSGGLPQFMGMAPKAQIVATDNGIKGLSRHYQGDSASHQSEIRRRALPGQQNPPIFRGVHAALARQYVHLC